MATPPDSSEAAPTAASVDTTSVVARAGEIALMGLTLVGYSMAGLALGLLGLLSAGAAFCFGKSKWIWQYVQPLIDQAKESFPTRLHFTGPGSADAANAEVFFAPHYVKDIDRAFREALKEADLDHPSLDQSGYKTSSSITLLGFAFPLADYALRWGLSDPNTAKLAAKALRVAGRKPNAAAPEHQSGIMVLCTAITNARTQMSRAELIAALVYPAPSQGDEIRDLFLSELEAETRVLRELVYKLSDEESFPKLMHMTCKLSCQFAKQFDRERFMSAAPQLVPSGIKASQEVPAPKQEQTPTLGSVPEQPAATPPPPLPESINDAAQEPQVTLKLVASRSWYLLKVAAISLGMGIYGFAWFLGSLGLMRKKAAFEEALPFLNRLKAAVKDAVEECLSPPTHASQDHVNVSAFLQDYQLQLIERDVMHILKANGLTHDSVQYSGISRITVLALAFPVADFALRWGLTHKRTLKLFESALIATKWSPLPTDKPGQRTIIIQGCKAIMEVRSLLSREEMITSLSSLTPSPTDAIKSLFVETVESETQAIRQIFHKMPGEEYYPKVAQASRELALCFAKSLDRERFMSPAPAVQRESIEGVALP